MNSRLTVAISCDAVNKNLQSILAELENWLAVSCTNAVVCENLDGGVRRDDGDDEVGCSDGDWNDEFSASHASKISRQGGWHISWESNWSSDDRSHEGNSQEEKRDH